jgi:hypothetical protein
MLTLAGLKAMNARLVSDDVKPFIFIGIGEGDKPESDDDMCLSKELKDFGMQRRQANIEIDDDGSVTLQAEFNCTSKASIKEIGLFNELNGGVMLTRSLVGAFEVGIGTQFVPKIKLDIQDFLGENK